MLTKTTAWLQKLTKVELSLTPQTEPQVIRETTRIPTAEQAVRMGNTYTNASVRLRSSLGAFGSRFGQGGGWGGGWVKSTPYACNLLWFLCVVLLSNLF